MIPIFCFVSIERHYTLCLSHNRRIYVVLLLQMQVWDTAGQERFRTITQSYYRSAHGAVVAYDITRRATFESVSHWIREVEQFGAASVVLILIGKQNEDN